MPATGRRRGPPPASRRGARSGCANRAPRGRARHSLGDALPEPRIHEIAQTVAEEIEAEERDRNREPGQGEDPRTALEIFAPVGHDHAQRRRGWLHADAEEAEPSLDDDPEGD